MQNFFIIIFIILLCKISFSTDLSPEYIEKGFSDISISSTGNHLAYSMDTDPGLHLLNTSTNESIKISSGRG